MGSGYSVTDNMTHRQIAPDSSNIIYSKYKNIRSYDAWKNQLEIENKRQIRPDKKL